MYDVYIGEMLLPVTPQRIEMEVRGKNETIELVNGGEANLPRPSGLTDVELTALLPRAKLPFARYAGRFIAPQTFLNYFAQLKEEAAPFRLIVCRKAPDGSALFDTNLPVCLEDYRIIEDAGNGCDLSVRLRMRQYAAHSRRTVEIGENMPSAPIVIEEERESIGNPSISGAGSGRISDVLQGVAEKVQGAVSASAAEAKALIEQVEKIVGRTLSVGSAKDSASGEKIRLISRR